MKKGIIIRNQQEQLAIDTLIKAHEWLCNELNLTTSLTFQRECNWGQNAKHAGWHRSKDNLIALNFRNMYGASIEELLEVLSHEIRHAAQHKNGFLKNFVGQPGVRYLKGNWKGKDVFTSYDNAPWEIDARKYEKPYTKKVIKGLGISEDVLNTKLPMGTLTKSDIRATQKMIIEKNSEVHFLTKSWITDKKKTKLSGCVFVLDSDLPNGFDFKSEKDCEWLSNKQKLIKFTPSITVTEEYGGFSVRQMVS